MVTPLGAGVTQADIELIGSEHGAALNHKPSAGSRISRSPAALCRRFSSPDSSHAGIDVLGYSQGILQKVKPA